VTASITAPVGSYESGAVNRPADVRTVQELLTQAAKRLNNPAFDPKGADGKIAKPGANSNTVKAITAFQKQQAGMANPDARVDVNGNTWKKLVAAAGPTAAPKPTPPVVGLVTLTVTHGGLIPTGTVLKPPTKATSTGLYESTFTLSGGMTGTFRGSIYPDSMTVKGRVVDGTYPLHIGFHKGGGAAKQPASELTVQTQGIRPGLLVNARNPVPVYSHDAGKTTSVGVNVHNGFNGNRGSDGCLTLHPDDWAGFIKLFLDGFPNIDDWHAVGTNTGKQVGSLVITAS
jgi:hypothetical protein